MLEVEMKFKLPDPKATWQRLQDLEFTALSKQEEQDDYFNAPDRDFSQTDEALRIRHVGTKAILTYKGPKQGERGKVRTEIEVPLSCDHAAESLSQILTNLGYRPVHTVSKVRTLLRNVHEPELEVAWDDVQGLGIYLELEIKADEQEEHVLQRLQALAKELRLGEEERRSYLDLLLRGGGVSDVNASAYSPAR